MPIRSSANKVRDACCVDGRTNDCSVLGVELFLNRLTPNGASAFEDSNDTRPLPVGQAVR